MPDAEIILYDNLSRGNHGVFFNGRYDSGRVRFVKGDLLDTYALDKLLKETDIVIHLAAKVSHPDHDMGSHYYDQINHWGMGILADLVLASDRTKQLIYLSSSTVYGDHEEPKTEEDEPNPTSFYAWSKYRGEQQVAKLLGKKKVHILRSGNVYGFNPSLRRDTVVNKFMFDAQYGHRILINGDGQQVRCFLHIDKLCRAIRQIIAEDIPQGTWNIAEHNFSINTLAASMKEIYPELEYLSINQNTRMKNNMLRLPCAINRYVDWPERSFEEELKVFKDEFAF